MLLKLYIENIALIKNIEINFDKGLNIITGETGSGKSVLINSLKALMGDRVYREIIRTGCNSALIQAVFSLDKDTIDAVNSLGFSLKYDENVILTRHIYKSGKNLCKINNSNVNVSMLGEIGAFLVDIHGQFDSRNLISPETHIDVIDQFGYKNIKGLLSKYNNELSCYKKNVNKLKGIAKDKNELERKIDMLKYQINEIEAAKLKDKEEETLNEKKDLMTNMEKIMLSLNKINQLLSDDQMSVISIINEIASNLADISQYKKEYADMESTVKDILYKFEDISFSVSGFLQETNYNPNELDEINQRLESIKQLKRKYGNNIPEILEYCDNAKEELNTLQNSESVIEDLKQKIEVKKKLLYKVAKKIHNQRQKVADELKVEISTQLHDMEMKKVSFEVDMDFPEYSSLGTNDFEQNGLDTVEFLISPNHGEDFKSLAKIASGGEISRIMLAMKIILLDRNEIPVMIFDEIDTGISGEAALKTGRKIYDISQSCQVICVTHLPQIACMADHHYIIKKENTKNGIFTNIKKLNDEQTADRLASLLDGNMITQSGLVHANDMLSKAEEYKS